MRGGVPPIATAVVKATACAGSRTERSAGAVSCFSVSKVRGRGGGGGDPRGADRLRHRQPVTALAVVVVPHTHPSISPNAAFLHSGSRPSTARATRHPSESHVVALLYHNARHPSRCERCERCDQRDQPAPPAPRRPPPPLSLGSSRSRTASPVRFGSKHRPEVFPARIGERKQRTGPRAAGARS